MLPGTLMTRLEMVRRLFVRQYLTIAVREGLPADRLNDGAKGFLSCYSFIDKRELSNRII
jgi:hypothetical protein